ncbi:unnamed protein product [Toxocara canis]|uniref:Derlin n=1 Tax=Toxocara canis TaxID=6265 RepID=A0A183US55_TOXCA|nr:unnamed protein product [Toxocara canis]
MADFGDWYRSVPEITRYWFTGTTVLPLLGRFGLFSPYYMLLEWHLFFYKFQIWRPVTALFYYPLSPQTGFHWLLMLYFLYNYSKGTETGVFDGRPADYLFMLVFNWIMCCVKPFDAVIEILRLMHLQIICMAAGVYFLLEPMVLSVLYIWCQLNKDQIVQFWFGTQFKAMYLPWILVAFNMVLRGGGMNELIGILVGHSYYFLMFKYPQDFGGRAFLNTPEILMSVGGMLNEVDDDYSYKWFPSRVGGVHGFGMAPSNRRPAASDGADHVVTGFIRTEAEDEAGVALAKRLELSSSRDWRWRQMNCVPLICDADLYAFSSSSSRIIAATDHAAVQIDFADVDPTTGRMIPNKVTRYAICGEIRRMGESDDCILRLAQRDGIIPTNL